MQAEQKMVDAKAEVDSGLYKTQKQAEANDLLSRSVTQELIQYETMRKWDGQMPKVSGAGVTPLIQLPGGTAGSASVPSAVRPIPTPAAAPSSPAPTARPN